VPSPLRGRLAAKRAERDLFEDADYALALGKDRAIRTLGRIDSEIEALEHELANVTRAGNAGELPDAASARDHWPSLTTLERRQILGAMLSAVVVGRSNGRRRAPLGERVSLVWLGEHLPVERPRRGNRPHKEIKAGMVAA
jgi:hypothetical protein